MTIRTQHDLNRANIQAAWAFSRRLSSEQFEELCRVTVEQIRRDAQDEREVGCERVA